MVAPVIIAIIITAIPLILPRIPSTSRVIIRYVTSNWPTIKILIDSGLKNIRLVSATQDAKVKADAFFKQGKIVIDLRIEVDKLKKRHDKATKSYNKIVIALGKATNPKTIKSLKRELPKSKRNLDNITRLYHAKDKKYTNAITKILQLSVDAYLSFKELLKKSKKQIS